LLCVLVSATTLSELGFSDFFGESQTWRFLFNNSLLVVGQVEVYLPGMFTTNPVPGQVNAPLWTLQYEVLMYCWLAAIYLLGRFTTSLIAGAISTFLIITLAVASMTIYLTNISQPQPDTSITANLVRFAAMFFTGAGFYLLRNRVRLSTLIVALLSILIIVSYGIRPLFITLTYLSLAYLLLYLAYVPSGRIRLFNRLGDYSYGLYIFGYPIQQTLVYTWPNIGPAALFVLSLLLALFFAVVSWHLVEKPFLSMKPGLPQ
jgi:peptidoglycan/LPS O-acetylase OafA/YrhL